MRVEHRAHLKDLNEEVDEFCYLIYLVASCCIHRQAQLLVLVRDRALSKSCP